MSALSKRLPREFVHNMGKYLGLCALMVLSISIASGAIAVERSAIKVIEAQRAQANCEDFSVTVQSRLTSEQRVAAEGVGSGSTVYENFETELPGTLDGQEGEKTFRLYEVRTQCNLPVYYEGTDPRSDDEIALDRTFCVTNGLKLGDTLSLGGRTLRICGLLVLPDYQALVRSNTSLIYDTQGFAVGLVTPQAFNELSAGKVSYRYAVRMAEQSQGLIGRTSYERDFARALTDEGARVTDLVDKDSMLSRTYADDDLVADQAVWLVLSGVLIVVSAFIFAVLTNATVEQESALIGTLMASGYRRGELVRHYLALPLLVGVAAAAVGNLLGYVALSDLLKDMYYQHYSLPPYQAQFYPDLFVLTTACPLLLPLAITGLGVARKLGEAPLTFLRGEVGRRSRRSTFRLPAAWGYVARFRARVLLRNASHFAVLFVGIMLSSVLILFGTLLLPMVDHVAHVQAEALPARHLYLLKAPVEIEVSDSLVEAAAAAYEALLDAGKPGESLPAEEYDRLTGEAAALAGDDRVQAGHPLNVLHNSAEAVEGAEKVAITLLETPRLLSDSNEEVSVYGIEVGSSYWSLDVSGGKILMGRGLAEKCGLAAGEPVRLTNRFTGDVYDLLPDALVGNSSDMGIYMSRSTWGEIFAAREAEGDDKYFNAYASDEPLSITARYLSSERTPDDMAHAADQMIDTFGSMMSVIVVAALGVSIVVIYLLTKTTLDRSERAIGYMKVFGYRNREITGLYVRPVTLAVAASYVLSMPLALAIMDELIRLMMARYGGNFHLWCTMAQLVQCVAIGFSGYLVVAALHMRHIRRVGLAEAMRVHE